MGKNRLRKIIRVIHLWLGLSSGLVVFIVGLTGCLYVFQEEISLLFQSGVFRNVPQQQKPFISPLETQRKVETAFGEEITYMNATIYPKGDMASIVWVRDKKRKYTVFLLNPYSGEVIHSHEYYLDFWAIVLALHTSLLIPEYGHHIVAIATLVFVIMMISGLFLWFPKSKKGYKQRFSIKWGASFKRVNYDLHNVLGFYMTWLAIFIAISGLAWSYQWVEEGIYWMVSGENKPQTQEALLSSPDNAPKNNKIEGTFHRIINQYGDIAHYIMVYPYNEAGTYSLTINPEKGDLYNKNDIFIIDQYNGNILDTDLWDHKNNGDKLLAANYNIHVGSILGLPGKFLAFFASLIATSLPITGFIAWRNRKKKKWLVRRKRWSLSSRSTKKYKSNTLVEENIWQ